MQPKDALNIAERKAWKELHIKNLVPVVVTQEDVHEYRSVESAVNGRVVEAEKVCNELNRIHLIEFNAIGFDLIEFNSISFNRICLWTGQLALLQHQSQTQKVQTCIVPWLLSRYGVDYKRDGCHVVVMQIITAPVKRDNLARHFRATDVVVIQLANQVAEKVL